MCGTQRYLWIKLAAVVLIVLSVPAASKSMYVSGELVIKMEPGYSIELVNSQFGTWVDQHLPQLDVYLAQAGSGGDLDSLASLIQAMPEVQFCHPNYVVDPLQPVQSSLPVSDEMYEGSYTRQEAYDRLGLGSAHGVCTGEGVHLAVLDGGVNYYHPELQTCVASGYDYVGDDTDAFDEPGGLASGHGTFVAGVTHLVAPNATVNAYRVSDTSGLGDGYVVAEAILQAVEDGCRVVNLSLVTTAPHQAIAQAAAHAAGQGVLLVAAAGNGYADSAHYPASDPSVLSVAAVDTLDLLADFSSFGGHVDVCAPGTHIYSPYLDTGYAWWGGTSFAAPFVAAQAALLWDFKPEATLQEVTDAILATAVNIDHLNPDLAGKLGAGLINPLGSIIAIRGGANALRVPSEYPTIQAAINASLDGDTVLVAPGEYWESVNLAGKTIVLMSELGAGQTIWHPVGPYLPIVKLWGDYSAPPVIKGFTFTGAYDAWAIEAHCYGATIAENIFTANNVGLTTGYCIRTEGCTFPSDIHHNIFVGNGGEACIDALQVFVGSSPIAWVVNNTFVDNKCCVRLDGSSSASPDTVRVSIFNNIFSFSSAEAVSNYSPGRPQLDELAYNLFWQNELDWSEELEVDSAMQLFADPMFVNPADEDFRLLPGSPAVNAGHPDSIYNDQDGTRNDIGAFPLASMVMPIASDFGIVARNTLVPDFTWRYVDSAATSQYQYQIQVGSDNDWVVAELWDSGPVTSSDSAATYMGSPLNAYTTYYARARVSNGSAWGQWQAVELMLYEAPAIFVPSEMATIQQAVDLVEPGDTAYVEPGTYNEALVLPCKGSVVSSTDGAQFTTIEPPVWTPTAVQIHPGDSSLELRGMTFRGAQQAMLVPDGSRLTVRECRIADNTAYGILANGPESLIIVGTEFVNNMRPVECEYGVCRFDSNLVVDNHGIEPWQGISFRWAIALVRRNIFARNNCYHALNLRGGDSVDVRNNTVYGTSGVGIRAYTSGTIFNNLVAFNGGNGIELVDDESSSLSVGYNDSYGNLGADRVGFTIPNPGGISADPLFADTTSNDFALQVGSPCIDAGHPDSSFYDQDGTRNDIGAVPGPPVQYPIAANVAYDPVDAYGDVTTFTPTIFWSYQDTVASTQLQYHLQVGTDPDWSVAEMWDTGPVTSGDTEVVYDGASLEAWTRYVVRIRVDNGADWGSWYASAFYVRTRRTAYVPDDFTSIQAAINGVRSGDSVVVAPGTYFEHINFGGKAIVVMSSDGPGVTFIQPAAGDTRALVTLVGNEDSTSVIRGFTLRYSATRAIEADNSAVSIIDCNVYQSGSDAIRIQRPNGPVVIRGCTISDNAEGRWAGGLYASRGRFIIEYNRITSNYGSWHGGGMRLYEADSSLVRYNLFANNSTRGLGGGVDIFGGTGIRIYNNTFYGNWVNVANPSTLPFGGGGVRNGATGATDIRNNIIVQNGPGHGILGKYENPDQVYEYNDLYLNTDSDYVLVVPGEGSLSVDPLFVDPANGDFSLMDGSPCIDAGDPGAEFRDPNGTRNDMGAFPWEPRLPRAANLNLGDEDTARVISPTPTFYWSYEDTAAAQQAYEIQVATDAGDWSGSLVWQSGQVSASDTSAAYGGTPLSGGTDYVARVHVFNGTDWGGWNVIFFHVNGAPSVPQPVSPLWSHIVGPVVDLTVASATDPENDSLRYDFQLTLDENFDSVVFAAEGAAGRSVSVPDTLQAGAIYRWRARCSDGDAHSLWVVDSFLTVALQGRVGLVKPDADSLQCGQTITFVLEIENDALDPAVEVVNGFTLFSPDGAQADSVAAVWMTDSVDWSAVFDQSTDVSVFQGQTADTVGFVGRSGAAGTGLTAATRASAWTITAQVSCEFAGRQLCVDKAAVFQPNLQWAWLFDDGVRGTETACPAWSGPICFTIGDCCRGRRGNVDGDEKDDCNIADLTYLVNYLFMGGPEPNCLEEANADADPQGSVNIADLTTLVDYMFGSLGQLRACGEYVATPPPKAELRRVTVSVEHRGDQTVVQMQTEVPLRGVKLSLVGPDDGPPRKIGLSPLDLLYSRDGEKITVGLVDLDGTEVISAGVHELIVLPGQFSVSSAEVSDLYHRLLSATIVDGSLLPTDFALHQNYPNPFNPFTAIEFALPWAAHVRLTVFNILGQEVRRLVDEPLPAGKHVVTWDATDSANEPVCSGVYFYRFETEQFSAARKMLLLK